MPMPALTFMHRTIHRSQNCGVRQASPTSTLWRVIMALPCVGGVQPTGCQSGGGTR